MTYAIAKQSDFPMMNEPTHYSDRARHFSNNGWRRHILAVGAKNAEKLAKIGIEVPAYRIFKEKSRRPRVQIPWLVYGSRGRLRKQVEWLTMF